MYIYIHIYIYIYIHIYIYIYIFIYIFNGENSIVLATIVGKLRFCLICQLKI